MRKICTTLLALILLVGISACSFNKKVNDDIKLPDKIGEDLILIGEMELEYASCFAVGYYRDGSNNEYKLISIVDEDSFLIVPKGIGIPQNLPKDVKPIYSPESIYLVASPAMDMMVTIDALDLVRFVALNSDDWYIEEAKESMDKGDILYAGKYSSPDYELILNKNCDMAVENTMIYHTPEVKEKLESFDIPVLVDKSSYETEPLGRTEWVKLYGALTNHEQQAIEAFDSQANLYEEITSKLDAEDKPTVAFFYIAANGSVKVRKSNDYIPKMIAMAGGSYVFEDLVGDDSVKSSTVNMQMEEFYEAAKEADYIIYNSTVAGELTSLEDFAALSSLLKNMKAVKNGNVYCTYANIYQEPMSTGIIIQDIYNVIQNNIGGTYIYRLD